MFEPELLFLLILFVVCSSPDCIHESGSTIAKCTGHSFDSFHNIGNKCRIIKIDNPPNAVFVLNKSRNQQLHLIEILELAWTESLVITEYGFKDFASLFALNLQYCSIATLKSNWFLANNNITNFDCSNNKLVTLLKSDLENLRMLTIADFSHNLLESIEPHTFSEMKELQDLRLADNKLKIIPTGHMPMLQILILAQNLIDIVPTNAFTEMPKLQKICLPFNALWKIENGSFKGLKDLTLLYLSNNFIEEITELAFSGLSETTLNLLDLSSNKIRRIAPGAFKGIPVLDYLGFSKNLINEVNQDMLEGLDSKVLMLDHNEIKIIGNNTFKGFKTLEHLHINDNKLGNLSADIFGTNLSNLTQISVRNNSISQLDSDLFFTLNIEAFLISSNKLRFLPQDIFIPLKNLRYLQLQDNLIEELNEGHIKSLKSLHFFSIEHNNLTFIPLKRNSFPKLKEMRIGGSPWQCACLDEVQNFLYKKNVSFVKKYYFDGQCPVCVPTYFKHCEKNADFARWTRFPETYESHYRDQCRIKYLNDRNLSKTELLEEFVTAFHFCP